MGFSDIKTFEAIVFNQKNFQFQFINFKNFKVFAITYEFDKILQASNAKWSLAITFV